MYSKENLDHLDTSTAAHYKKELYSFLATLVNRGITWPSCYNQTID